MKINVFIARTGETVPVEEIDLGQVTNVTLIQELINSGQIAAPQGGSQYRLIGKQNEILSDTVTLQEAGFKDGDTITLVEKALAASYYLPTTTRARVLPPVRSNTLHRGL